jgi:hypothetical protein
MVNFTLIEVHLDDGNLQFGPSGLDFVPDDEDHLDADEGTNIDIEDDQEASGGRGVLSYVLALAVLAGLAVAAKKFRGGSDDGFEELAELDDLAEEA